MFRGLYQMPQLGANKQVRSWKSEVRSSFKFLPSDFKLPLRGALAVHDQRIELAQLAEIDEVGGGRFVLGQPLQVC